jgi:hypothetical protein
MMDAIMALFYTSVCFQVMVRPTYKLLKPSNTDRPIFNFGAIWSLYIMTAGIIVRAISVIVFVAPWKYPKSA